MSDVLHEQSQKPSKKKTLSMEKSLMYNGNLGFYSLGHIPNEAVN